MVKLKKKFLGKNISYQKGMNLMHKSIKIVQSKCIPGEGEILFLESTDTITFTKQHGCKHLLINPDILKEKNIELIETNRGGDIAFHGQGQLIGYSIIKLPQIFDSKSKYSVNLGNYVRNLEKALVESCKELGVKKATTIKGYTGVWVHINGHPKKLVAIGVGVSKGITSHGFAININNDLTKFLKLIVPCGLYEMGVTNLVNIFKNSELCFCWKNICNIIGNNLDNFLTVNLK